MMLRYLVSAVFLLSSALFPSTAQVPSQSWKPNYTPLGVYCYSGAPYPNNRSLRHGAGCGCENSPFRWKGEMYMMESTAHYCEEVFAGYNNTIEGDCSYMRIRRLSTGEVVHNIKETLRHSFASAIVRTDDNGKPTLWVFASAHARGNKVKPGPCDITPYRGCYVGAWSSTDLVTWTPTSKALVLPDGHAFFNNDVTIITTRHNVSNMLPPHQAAMVLEQRRDSDTHQWISPFAINTGTDGDLSKNWELLDVSKYGVNITKGLVGESVTDAPSLTYDDKLGYYYLVGGGWITNGPARSRNLLLDSWEVASRKPMAAPSAVLASVGLPLYENHINTTLYTGIWENVTFPIHKWIGNLSKWNWGVTDPDTCCQDDIPETYLMHTLSQQGAPKNFTGKPSNMAAMGYVGKTQGEWLDSYFH